MRRLFALLLPFALVLPLASCASGIEPVGGTPTPNTAVEENTAETETKTEEERILTEEEKQILAARRDEVADYMNQMASILWRSDEEIVYTIKSGVSPDQVKNGSGSPVKLTIVKDRLYRGLPYTYAGNGIPSFSEYFSATDSKGVSTLSGMTWQDLSGGFAEARIGNDCSTAVMQAWGQMGAHSFQMTNTQYMTADQGYLPVGGYKVSGSQLTATKDDCLRNGTGVMYAAYAALQKGDAVVQRNNGAGHAMLVTSVHAVPLGSGFDPKESYITVTHQTRGKYSKDAKYYSEEHGEDVYYWYGIDDKYTFAKLFSSGYLPITCKELIDPAPLDEPSLTSSVTELTPENMLTGTLSATRMMEKITAEIRDPGGKVLQSAFVYPTRKTKFEFACEDLANSTAGKIDPSALPPGTYAFSITVTFTDGTSATAREFTFQK